MSDDLSNLILGSQTDGDAGMIAIGSERITDLPALLQRLPELTESGRELDLARLANHLARRKE